MSIKGYFGATGSGKTYEVVENVIVPAIAQGRRVVTNIAGIDIDAIIEYLVVKGHDEEKLGTIKKIVIGEETAGKFAVIVGDGEDAYLDAEKSLVQGGDLVVLDEVWRVWEDGTKIHPDDAKFLRMHRHLTNPDTHVACDVAVIAQNFMDVHRKVRSLIEERYEMSKHLKLGLRNRYNVAVFTKGAKKAHLNIGPKKYEPEIYNLYKSHSMGAAAGRESNIDGRGSVLRGALFKLGIPLALLAGLIGAYGMVRFFSPGSSPLVNNGKIETADGKSLAASPTGPSAPGATSPGTKPVIEKSSHTDDEISQWRVAGYASDGKDAIVFIDVGARGLMQRIADPKAVISGQYVELDLDGKKVGSFSGKDKKRDSGPTGSH